MDSTEISYGAEEQWADTGGFWVGMEKSRRKMWSLGQRNLLGPITAAPLRPDSQKDFPVGTERSF